ECIGGGGDILHDSGAGSHILRRASYRECRYVPMAVGIQVEVALPRLGGVSAREVQRAHREVARENTVRSRSRRLHRDEQIEVVIFGGTCYDDGLAEGAVESRREE